jgi:hypothetical protein
MQFSSSTTFLNSDTWDYSPHTPDNHFFEQGTPLSEDELLSDSLSLWAYFPSGVEMPQPSAIGSESPSLQERKISILSQSQAIPPSEIPSPYVPQLNFQFPSTSSPRPQESSPFVSSTPPMVTGQNPFVPTQEVSFLKQLGADQPVQLNVSQMISYSNFPLFLTPSLIQEDEELVDDENPIIRHRSQSDPSPVQKRTSKRASQLISKETKLNKQEIRREKNRLSAQASRLRQKLHVQELEKEQSNTLALGQKVEEYVEHYRLAHPHTTLPSLRAFVSGFQSSSEELSDKAEQVEITQNRIEQVIDILSKEAIDAERQKNSSIHRNALLEERIRQLELENRTLRQQATKFDSQSSL